MGKRVTKDKKLASPKRRLLKKTKLAEKKDKKGKEKKEQKPPAAPVETTAVVAKSECSEPQTPVSKIRPTPSPTTSQRGHIAALMEVKKAAAAEGLTVEQYLARESAEDLEDRLAGETGLQDDDESGEGSSEPGSEEEESAEGSEELPASSASGSESGDGDGSEAAVEDESEDDASSATESLSSSDEKPTKKQKTEKHHKTETPDKPEKKTEKPNNREKKTEKPHKEKKTEKPHKEEKTEKPHKEEKTEKPHKEEKTEKPCVTEEKTEKSSRRKEKKEKTEKQDALVAVEKLAPSTAAAIGKAMVSAGETTQQGAADFASTTHKNEWDKFSRQVLDKRKCTTALAAHVEKNKLDMRAENSTLARKERQGLKKREIEKKKAKALIEKLLKKKMYDEDEDFPGDEEEYFFYVNGGSKMRREAKTTESLGLKVKDTAPDKGLVDALTSEGGMLASGALPAIEGMNEEGSKNLLDAMVKEGVAKPKPAKAKTEEDAEKMAPKEPWESLCQDRMNEILNESGASRKYALSLAHIEYSGDLSSDLQKHSSKLERIYGKLQGLKKAQVKKNSKYTKFYDIIDAMHAWYEKAEASAKGLLNGLNKKDKKKKAGKKANEAKSA
ncbi:unnamed protein product [Symbiodinium sp. CCMP2456]|nr:unnamed protein product [Symbiodinium sp. CCMP2456]